MFAKQEAEIFAQRIEILLSSRWKNWAERLGRKSMDFAVYKGRRRRRRRGRRERKKKSVWQVALRRAHEHTLPQAFFRNLANPFCELPIN